jgi:hypothetical protein
MEFFIEYLNAKNGFAKTRIEFKTYQTAKDWGYNNLEKFSSDMIRAI